MHLTLRLGGLAAPTVGLLPTPISEQQAPDPLLLPSHNSCERQPTRISIPTAMVASCNAVPALLADFIAYYGCGWLRRHQAPASESMPMCPPVEYRGSSLQPSTHSRRSAPCLRPCWLHPAGPPQTACCPGHSLWLALRPPLSPCRPSPLQGRWGMPHQTLPLWAAPDQLASLESLAGGWSHLQRARPHHWWLAAPRRRPCLAAVHAGTPHHGHR
mmetsp:Transcript_14021/g.30341  ORF Transcript_14021/g.30341 Transcript_14021/m.30341 type:complete len:215 (+) Transcript_14021:871-1515(+)